MAFNKGSMTDERPRYDCLFFDLDDTLYPLSSGLAAAFAHNIEDYVVQRLGVDRKKVTGFCRELYKSYGTTLAGLRAVGYDFDHEDYRSFIHERLPYDNLKPDLVLKNLLLTMPQRKIIFTNGDKAHTAKVLSKLELEDCFEGIICLETLNSHPQVSNSSKEWDAYVDVGSKARIICKPSKEAIERALGLANANPQRAVFFDDSERNIAAGKQAGLHTVLVGTSVRTEGIEGVDFALESIHNIKEALPEIWEESKSSDSVIRSARTYAIETVITA